MGGGAGALYTGRGPVCGMIVRGGAGATNRGAGGAAGSAGPPIGPAIGAATGADKGVAAEACRFTVVSTGAFGVGATTFGAAGGGTVNVGRGPGAGGTIIRGGAGVTVGAAGGGATVIGGAGAFAAGFASAAGGAGFATGAGTAGAFFCVSAFSTSPGREMFERSIFVLMPSLSRAAVLLPEPLPSLCFLKWARTFSASSASSELECVFFVVTPDAPRASRIALLLTSSSRARSLIRILLIRLYIPLCPLSAHRNPTAFQSS